MERTTASSLLRSTQALCLQICAKQTLDVGIAYCSERFAALPDANQFREVIRDDAVRLEDSFAQAETWFAERNLACHRWAPADEQVAEQLGAFLVGRGFRRRNMIAMALAEWRKLPFSPGVRVLPARAVRELLRRSFLDDDVPSDAKSRALLAESFNERMDDPPFDLFVATADRQPVGRVGLYQVGDIARIVGLAALPAFRGGEVERTLLGHALALAKRLTMPSVVALADEGDEARRELLKSAGFVEDGRIVEFERPTPFEALSPL